MNDNDGRKPMPGSREQMTSRNATEERGPVRDGNRPAVKRKAVERGPVRDGNRPAAERKATAERGPVRDGNRPAAERKATAERGSVRDGKKPAAERKATAERGSVRDGNRPAAERKATAERGPVRGGEKPGGGAPRRDSRFSNHNSGFSPKGKREPRVTARDAALRALQDVVRSDAYAAQALDRQLDEARLKPDDRRLAASLFYTAVENRLYIEYQLGRFLEQRPEPIINDILHIAAAQLLFMDRVPDHAAVDEAVKQVRATRKEGYTGLVNGVLRNLIRARDAGKLILPDREEDPQGWLSVRHSIAKPAARRLIEAYGPDEAERIAAWTPSHRAQTVRPNRTRLDGPGLEAWLDGQKLKWHRGVVEDAYVVEDAGNLAATEGYRKGLYSIQGESAMLAAQAVGARPGMQILDACAAPGGKTCLMAERMGGSGRVFAWDVHAHRVELIRAAARRLGLENVRPSERDAGVPLESVRLSMDAVLVDAPCSGLGVIADKPDIKYRQSEESLQALPPLQRRILDACAQAVKVGGLLVYATCTVLPDENEAQVRAFLKAHPEFVPDADDAWLPEALRPRWSEGMIQILPHRDGLEGFFIARLRRKGV